MTLDDLVTGIIYIVCFYAVFFIGKVINDLLHREYKLTHELVEKDNPALALAVAGYYAGLVLAIGGALAGPSNGIVADLIDLFIYGFLAVILLNLSWYACDLLILRRFKVSDELIRDRNPGTGVICMAVSLASGVIVFGAVTGQGGNVWTAAAFWASGQVMLILATEVYNRITPYDIHQEIEKDNVAAGVGFGGALLGVGIVVGLTAQRDFVSWRDDFGGFVLASLVGLALLPVVRFLTDKVLLPTVDLTDEIAGQEVPNIGAAYIEAISYIGAAFVISWSF